MFAERETSVGSRTIIKAAASLDRFANATFAAPRAQVRWKASERLSFAGSYAVLHQFAQSVRNDESVVGNIFPADLYVGAVQDAPPVARSDQGALGADYRPSPNVHIGVQAYARGITGALLVAPLESQPFVTGALGTGRATARGLSADASIRRPQFGLVARYALQDVRYVAEGASYVPNQGATHHFEGGAIVFPTPTLSLRLGITGEAGRRGTMITGPFEWDACTLSDRGCEFSGSPQTSNALGATKLPTYARADFGARKAWHPEVAGRPATVALFGAATNILGRRNLLTYASQSSTKVFTPIRMRPLAPLVVGVDWSF